MTLIDAADKQNAEKKTRMALNRAQNSTKAADVTSAVPTQSESLCKSRSKRQCSIFGGELRSFAHLQRYRIFSASDRRRSTAAEERITSLENFLDPQTVILTWKALGAAQRAS